jgi:hypothetical protein
VGWFVLIYYGCGFLSLFVAKVIGVDVSGVGIGYHHFRAIRSSDLQLGSEFGMSHLAKELPPSVGFGLLSVELLAKFLFSLLGQK